MADGEDDKSASAAGKRPNANYNLSYPDTKPKNSEEYDPEKTAAAEGLVFHYNREHRLENAPQSVRDIYAPVRKSRFGLLGVLVADRPRRFLFFIIIFLCILIFALSRLGFFDSHYMLDGNKIEVSGSVFEGNTIITIRKTTVNAGSYTGAADIAVSPKTQDSVYYHRIFFTMEKEEVYKFAAPFDSDELLMVIQNEKNSLQLSFKTQ